MDNGNPTRKDNGTATVLNQILITVTDPFAFTLKIAGQFPSLDYALNMLDQARRELDSQWRTEKALALQDRLRQKQQDDALAASLRNKTLRL
jgi:hypothetical protein